MFRKSVLLFPFSVVFLSAACGVGADESAWLGSENSKADNSSTGQIVPRTSVECKDAPCDISFTVCAVAKVPLSAQYPASTIRLCKLVPGSNPPVCVAQGSVGHVTRNWHLSTHISSTHSMLGYVHGFQDCRNFALPSQEAGAYELAVLSDQGPGEHISTDDVGFYLESRAGAVGTLFEKRDVYQVLFAIFNGAFQNAPENADICLSQGSQFGPWNLSKTYPTAISDACDQNTNGVYWGPEENPMDVRISEAWWIYPGDLTRAQLLAAPQMFVDLFSLANPSVFVAKCNVAVSEAQISAMDRLQEGRPGHFPLDCVVPDAVSYQPSLAMILRPMQAENVDLR